MKNFFGLVIHWLQWYYRKRNILFLLLVLVVSGYSVYKGGVEYTNAIADIKKFQEKEASIVNTIRNYVEYSLTGANVLFKPPLQSVFFTNPPKMSGLTGNVNSIVRFQTGKDPGNFEFQGYAQYRFRFSVIIKTFISFFALFAVFELLRRREYLRMIAYRNSPRAVLLSVLTAAFIFIALSFLIIFLSMIGVLSMQGISPGLIDWGGFVPYIIVTVVLILSFMVLGAFCATIRKGPYAFSALLAVWFLLVLIIPIALDSEFEEKSGTVTSSYQLDGEKLIIINNFEKWVLENKGKFDYSKKDIFREMAYLYINEHFPRVEAVDHKRREQIKRLYESYHFWCMFTPTTLYDITATQTGGRGYEAYLGFYDYLLEIRRGFLLFWVDRVYNHDPKEMVSFIEKTSYSNVYRRNVSVLLSIVPGVLFNLFLCLVFLMWTLHRFPRYLHSLENREAFGGISSGISLKKGQLTVLWSRNPLKLTRRIYNIFSRRERYNIPGPDVPLSFNGETAPFAESIDFLYVCHPLSILRESRVRDFVSFWCRVLKLSRQKKREIFAQLEPTIPIAKPFNHLDTGQCGKVLLVLLPYFSSTFYLVESMERMSGWFLMELNSVMRKWAVDGSSVLYVTVEKDAMTIKIKEPEGEYLEQPYWSDEVERLKELN